MRPNSGQSRSSAHNSHMLKVYTFVVVCTQNFQKKLAALKKKLNINGFKNISKEMDGPKKLEKEKMIRENIFYLGDYPFGIII
jgi:hypothetical protein